MTHLRLPLMDADAALIAEPADPDAGFGSLQTPAGNLPLEALSVHARIVGLTTEVRLTQRFVNPHRDPIEAVYIYPLPDRGAVTAMRMTAADRTVVARLQERATARQEYASAVAAGHRAALAEQDRPDVFSIRVGNILAGERVSIELTVLGVLAVDDGQATFRFPLVVARRYVPGEPLPGDSVGDGYAPDTDAVPDASRITPPVLLPGFARPVRLDVEIDLDPAGLTMGTPSSSLHAIQVDGRRIRIEPGARVDRDVVLRIPIGSPDGPSAALCLVADVADEGSRTAEGTFELTLLPPVLNGSPRQRDLVLLLDRSGSMSGWKMVAARRAAARIVDTLTDQDRFAVMAFDDRVDTPTDLPEGLSSGSDRHRFRAVRFLAGLTARGGTELSDPLRRSLALLQPSDPRRDRVLVLVTDGQVAGEDQLIRVHAEEISGVRLHTVGIDRAVNAGFLGRLASLGGGRCELVESEDRLDQAMTGIHRRIGSPLVRDLRLEPDRFAIQSGTVTPARLPDLFTGVPYVVRGRYTGDAAGAVTLRGVLPDGTPWSVSAAGRRQVAPAVTAGWARSVLGDLEDRFVAGPDRRSAPDQHADPGELEDRMVTTSLRFGVMCRFTAFVAVDARQATDGSTPRTVIQPVEPVSDWQHVPAPTGAWPDGVPAAAAVRTTRSPAAPMRFAPDGAGAAGLARTPAAFASAPAPSTPAPPDREVLRVLLAAEARRLRDLSAAVEQVRRDALLDLATRMIPVAQGIPDGTPDRQAWLVLIELLRSDRLSSGPIEDLWVEVLRALDSLSGESGAGGETGAGGESGTGGRGSGMRHPAFWRHFPDR